jgi:hypothetical protein
LDAIISVLFEGGDKASSLSLDKVKIVSMQNIFDDDESIRAAAANCIAAICVFFDASQITDILIDLIGNGGGSTKLSGCLCLSPYHNIVSNLTNRSGGGEAWTRSAGRLSGIGAVLQSAGQRSLEVRDEAFSILLLGMKDERISVKSTACWLAHSLPLPFFYCSHHFTAQ